MSHQSKKRKVDEMATIKKEEEDLPSPGRSLDYGSALGANVTAFKVGKNESIFRVHTKIMSEKAPSFYTRAVEGQGGLLPAQEPAVFGLFVEWIYTGHIQQISRAERDNLDEEEAEALDDLLSVELVKLYGFGLEFKISSLMDLCITNYMTHFSIVYVEDIDYAYINFAPCRLRKLMVHFLAYDLTHEHPRFTGDIEEQKLEREIYSKDVSGLLGKFEDLRMDVVSFMLASTSYEPLRDTKLNPLDLDPCLFHEHEGSEECKAKKK
ncbi:hypothetical protein HYFRA_00013533 [Hymenoscyphus fraxineus]|uniref:BTB domain-containing protein n=1 Tax=Hymenoscyphus fraxineus TaxID=746836 RepID=A0A9N9L5E4_9HELO|nr:hypothetical protein HYFRA_00013533 [Hymenoscyphus fraxineus]